jgi:hypothetical protein
LADQENSELIEMGAHPLPVEGITEHLLLGNPQESPNRKQ